MNVSNNRLTGSIPTGLGWDLRVEEFIASGNQLTGPIPRDLVEDTFLRVLFLDGKSVQRRDSPGTRALDPP